MPRQLPPESMSLDRRDFLNSLSALFVAHVSVEDGMNASRETDAYRQGFADALLAVAASAGIIEDFADRAGTIRQLHYRRWRTVPSSR